MVGRNNSTVWMSLNPLSALTALSFLVAWFFVPPGVEQHAIDSAARLAVHALERLRALRAVIPRFW